MSHPVLQNPHALAVIAELEAAGLAVGDGIRPDDVTEGRYTVFYMLPGPPPDGTLEDPDDDADLRFQLTHVGRVASEARYEADAAHEALTIAEISVEGRSVYRVRKLGGSDGTRRDDDVTPPRFYDVAIYGLFTTPA